VRSADLAGGSVELVVVEDIKAGDMPANTVEGRTMRGAS